MIKSVPVISFQPKNQQFITVIPKLANDAFLKLRPMQRVGYNKLKNAKHGMICMPTGSGKSVLIKAIFGERLLNNSKLRLLILLPQKCIADSFVSSVENKKPINIKLPSGKKIKFLPKHNLCNKSNTHEELKNFLFEDRDPTDVGDRIVLCTHVTFSKVFGDLIESKQFNVLENLIVVSDEGHHSASSELEGIGNSLGLILESLILDVTSCSVFIATATPFRHDNRPLLRKECMDKMIKYFVPVDEHIENTNPPISINVNFIITSEPAENVVLHCFKQQRKPTIVYIDPNSGREKTKYNIVNNIHKKCLTWRKDLKIVDLVKENTRTAELKEISVDTDLVTTLKVFIEGKDWVQAERAIVFGYRNSIVEIIQILGRLLRECPGKSNVELNIVLPLDFNQSDEEKFKQNINEYLKYLFAIMVVEDFIRPVKLDSIKIKSKSKNGKHSDSIVTMAFDDDYVKWSKYKKEAVEKTFRFGVDVEGTVFEKNKKIRTYLKSVIERMSKEYKIEGFNKELEDYVWSSLNRRSFESVSGIDLSKIDFNLIDDTVFILDGIKKFFSGVVDFKSLKELRNKIYDEPVNVTHPHLIPEWDDETEMFEYTAGSGYKAKWKCVKCHNKWSSTIYNRSKNKSSCNQCQGGIRSNIDDFINKSNIKYDSKYNYTNVVYINARSYVKIICPDHGIFNVTPDFHLHRNSGCKECNGYMNLNTNKFIKKAKLKWGNKFDYTKTIYVNTTYEVIIICHSHGEFNQIPRSHLLGHNGCKKCHGKSAFTTQEFIEQSEIIHKNKYYYFKVKYVNSTTKVIIICPIHGDFEQLPANHLLGKGCKLCGHICGGEKNKNNNNWISFSKARAIVRELGLKTRLEWIELKNSHNNVILNIPRDPYSYYRNSGWQGWADFLGH